MPSRLRYITVANSIRKAILDGVYAPGERLSRQHDLAKEHDVAFNTLKQALDLLSQEGYIIRKVGQGTYAALPVSQVPTALVVDDDAQIRIVLARALSAHKWNPTAVGSGEAALGELEDQTFDLIFLDLMLAGMNGAQTFQEILRKDPTAQVVIVTGFPDSKMMAAALETGPFAVMSKPYTLKALHTLLDQHDPRMP
ncbi:MAG: response regulator [Chloroflexi bacterium]|nr:response regulator [Chloroflexota bacterium]